MGCGREGQYICSECQKKLVAVEQICPMCCKPSLDGWTHTRCKSRYGMDRLLVGLSYRGMVQDCLKRVKYKSAWEIIEFLFSLCIFDLKGEIVTAVPMFAQKARERGFDQAEILGKLVAKIHRGRFLTMLERVRKTKPMFGLTRQARSENIKDAFRIINNHIPINKQIQNSNAQIPKQVILVDDVWTTGATMRECAQVLKRAGAREVWGVTLSR